MLRPFVPPYDFYFTPAQDVEGFRSGDFDLPQYRRSMSGDLMLCNITMGITDVRVSPPVIILQPEEFSLVTANPLDDSSLVQLDRALPIAIFCVGVLVSRSVNSRNLRKHPTATAIEDVIKCFRKPELNEGRIVLLRVFDEATTRGDPRDRITRGVFAFIAYLRENVIKQILLEKRANERGASTMVVKEEEEKTNAV